MYFFLSIECKKFRILQEGGTYLSGRGIYLRSVLLACAVVVWCGIVAELVPVAGFAACKMMQQCCCWSVDVLWIAASVIPGCGFGDCSRFCGECRCFVGFDVGYFGANRLRDGSEL